MSLMYYLSELRFVKETKMSKKKKKNNKKSYEKAFNIYMRIFISYVDAKS